MLKPDSKSKRLIETAARTEGVEAALLVARKVGVTLSEADVQMVHSIHDAARYESAKQANPFACAYIGASNPSLHKFTGDRVNSEVRQVTERAVGSPLVPTMDTNHFAAATERQRSAPLDPNDPAVVAAGNVLAFEVNKARGGAR